MTIRRGMLWTLVVGAAFAGFAPDAMARRGHGDRLHERLPLSADPSQPVPARHARLRLERRGDRQEVRLQIQGAPAGLDLGVWMDDGTGAFVQVGGMTERGAGEYVWRLRTNKGDPLPFGAADLSELSGRKIEVRTADGTAFAATLPEMSAPTARQFAKRPLRSGLAVDAAVAEALGATGAEAKVEVRRDRDGDEKFEVEVEHAPAGLSLELWIADAAGVMTLVGPLTEEADEEGGDDRDGLRRSGSDDDDDEEEGGAEYSLEVETEDGGTLPLGVTSVSELAGRRLEVRTAAGDVFASGTIPALADLPDDEDDEQGDDDDDDNDDQGEDDGGHEGPEDEGVED